jgi:hypothetical protein
MLADTLGWRPEQSNEVFELDRARLVQGDPAASSKLALDDPEVHPLLKLGAVLDDLEAWHAKAGRREAALEARLERATRLHSAFSEADDKAAVVADLAARLPGFADVPWWGWGMATLATSRSGRQAGRRGARPRPRARGRPPLPRLAGAKRCLHLAKAIEAPAYQLSAMAADAPGQRSIAIQHKNLAALYLRAFPYDLEKRIGEARNYNLLPDGEEMAAVLRSRRPAAEWKVDLPATPDFELHAPTRAAAPAEGAYSSWPRRAPTLRAPTTSCRAPADAHRRRPRAARAAGRGGAHRDVRAEACRCRAWPSRSTSTTGAPATPGGDQDHRRRGKARFKRREDGGSYFALARRGADVSLDPDYLYFPWEGTPSEASRALVFTDRSVYRPHQKIFWKVVGYRGRADLARWATLPRQAVTVSLRDASWQTVETVSVVTNEFGSAAGEFLVPGGRMLGPLAVVTNLGGEAA